MKFIKNICNAMIFAARRPWIFYSGLIAVVLQMAASEAYAGEYDGAMGKTNYVVYSGDVNGDGKKDLLVKAVPKIVMIPIDDDLNIPIPIPVPSPTFVLLSNSGGTFTLVSNPDAPTLAFAGWTAASYQLTFAGVDGTFSSSLTLTATTADLPSFVVAMSATTGQLQLTGAPTSSVELPVAITIPHLTNSDAGTLPGSLNVGTDGAASYSIALVVPPGTAGLDPELSLNYSSKGSNGMLGLGWSLGGLSVIHRCSKTIAQDGVSGRINFDDSDRLCLDGQRLVLANATPAGSDPTSLDAAYWRSSATGEDKAQFRTELESFRVITRLPTGYKVEGKDGKIHYYGNSASSTIAAQGRTDGKPLVWPLARTEDRSGNYMEMDYSLNSSTGEYLPKQIRYGGNSNAGQSTDLAVRFTFEARGDVQTQYIGGSRNDLRQRMTRVSTYIGTLADGTGGTLVRDYGLTYAYSSGSGRSLISTIKVCADTAQTNCLPGTSFTWGDDNTVAFKALPQIALPEFSTREGNPYYLNSLLYTGDMDGSGRTSFIIVDQMYTVCANICHKLEDFAKVLSGLIKIRLPDGTIIDRDISAGRINYPSPTALLIGDLDGDGRDDLVLANDREREYAVVGYCLNKPDVDGSPKFDCVEWNGFPRRFEGDRSIPSLVDLDHDRKLRLMMDPGQECSYQGGGMICGSRTVVANDVPVGQPYFNARALDLSKQGESDLYSVWKQAMPERPTEPYAQGVSVCWNRQTIECKNIYLATRDIASTTQLPWLEGVNSVGDLNGDGLTDFAYWLISKDPPPANNAALYICLSKENGVDCARVRDYTNGFAKAAIGDYLGDGLARLLLTYNTDTGTSSELCRYVDGGLSCQNVANQPAYWAPNMAVDLNGNGALALMNASIYGGGVAGVYTLSVAPTQDKVISVSNGNGLSQEVDYVRSDDNSVYRRFATIDNVEQRPVYPTIAAPAGVMVKQLRRNNGQGDWLRSNYRYEGMASNVLGRGGAGFALLTSTDQQSGISDETMLSQIYPYIGLVKRKRTYSSTCTLSEISNVFDVFKPLLTGGISYFPFVQKSDLLSKDLDCSEMGEISTVNEYTDGWGNLNVQTVKATDGDQTYTTKTAISFKTDVSPVQVHLSGLPVEVAVTKTNPDESTVTRTIKSEYDEVTGLQQTETVEPESSALKLMTTYDRSGNKFGLVNKLTQAWTNPACADTSWPETGCVVNKTRTVATTTYDSKGRFAEKIVNAEGLSESRGYDAGTGAQISSISPNGLTTNWGIDSFGSVTTETRPDGNQTRFYLKRCGTDCPSGAAVVRITDTFHGASRIAVPQLEFSDRAGHVLRKQQWSFDGVAVFTDSEYDSLGRLTNTYQPRLDGRTKYLAQGMAYDALNRVTSVKTLDEGNGEVTATTDYQGMKRVLKNGKQQERTEIRDVNGQLTQVTDSNDGPTGPGTSKFSYEPFGNLSKTTDPGGHVIKVAYDRLGRRIELQDPDLGRIEYALDPLGQVWRQISPKQRAAAQATYFAYDLLGRMTARYETDLKSHWIYDSAAMGKGQLAEAYTGGPTNKDYRRVHAFDATGRPLQTTQYLTDATYTSKTDYDNWGRVVTQTYQRGSDAVKRFDTRYNGMGYLSSIERGALTLWRVRELDAAGRATGVTLGNGLVQERTYSAYSGRLTNALVKAGATAVLQEGYSYDVLGNVGQRTQYWGQTGFDEHFTYDGLNRLWTSKIGGEEQIYKYTADGNLLSKTGVGTGDYVYPPGVDVVRPHAVRSIPGVAGTFEYDDNGNLTSGNGRTTTWTSFDMPLKLTKGSEWSGFTYGPEHQRTRQDRSGASTIYAGAQEVENVNGQVTVKTYWPNGIGVEIDKPGGAATELNWTHVDRLGSMLALSGADGALKERLAFDAWGKRRMLTSQAVPDSIDGVVDNKGYTGHEMLDRLDLVHMNGRIYDPLIGRFISADILIQDPMNGQSYNRYSYVLNNPTNLTDPTGFYSQSCTPEACKPLEPEPELEPKPKPPTVTITGKRESSERAEIVSVFVDMAPVVGSVKSAAQVVTGKDLVTGEPVHRGVETAGIVAGLVPGGKALLKSGKIAKIIGKLLGKGCCCFPAGTPIATELGTMPIEEVRVGQLVYARDPKTGETRLKPVTQVMITPSKPLFTLVTRSARGKVESTEVTDNHPYWVKDKGWIDSAQLIGGMILQSLDEGELTVVSVTKLGRDEVTYNFTVADFHTYFAGDQKAFVHNCTCAIAADKALEAGKNTGAAAELKVGDRVFTGVSGEVVPHNSAVTGALMGTPASAPRKPWHGGCAEIVCLDKALNAGVDPAGGTVRAVNIGASGGGHGTPKVICSSCVDVLDYFKVGQ